MYDSNNSMYHNSLQGICKGVVVDTVDPEGTGRIRVRISALYGVPEYTGAGIANDELPWARVSSISAGPGRGTQLTPNKGDIVWVMFEDGDKTKPIVMGYDFSPAPSNESRRNKSATANPKLPNNAGTAESTPLGTRDKLGNAQILYKSKKGAEVGFYEEENKETFRIIDSLGQIFEFGSQSPKGTPARSSGDRTRKPVMPEGVHGQGYINIQIAADELEEEDDETQENQEGTENTENTEKRKLGESSNEAGDRRDPKLFLAPSTFHLDNSISKISAEKDHIIVQNEKAAMDISDKNIKLSNAISSIDIISNSSDSDLADDANMVGGSDTDAVDGKEVVIITNGSCVLTMKDKDMIITVPGNLIIGAGNIIAGAAMNILETAGMTIACGANAIFLN